MGTKTTTGLCWGVSKIPWRRAAPTCLRTISDVIQPAVYVHLISASGGTVSGEGLECSETSDSEESIARALLTSLSRSCARSRTSFCARVATGGCTNFGSASALYVKRGNGGGAVLRPTTPSTCAKLLPKSAKALYVKWRCACETYQVMVRGRMSLDLARGVSHTSSLLGRY